MDACTKRESPDTDQAFPDLRRRGRSIRQTVGSYILFNLNKTRHRSPVDHKHNTFPSVDFQVLSFLQQMGKEKDKNTFPRVLSNSMDLRAGL